jgi:hypothetical protein
MLRFGYFLNDLPRTIEQRLAWAKASTSGPIEESFITLEPIYFLFISGYYDAIFSFHLYSNGLRFPAVQTKEILETADTALPERGFAAVQN